MINPWLILGVVLAFVVVGLSAYHKGETDATNRLEAEYLARSVKAEQAAREEEQRRAKAQKDADAKHDIEVKVAQTDANNANDALAKLRKRIAGINQSPIYSGTTASCPTTATLSDVFSECTGRYTEMGKEADAARVAGLLCQEYYQSNIANKVIEALK